MVRSVDPRTGVEFGPSFTDADANAVATAVADAVRAGEELAKLGPSAIAAGLAAAADALDADTDALVGLADSETALGTARLTSEVARTSSQLRSFATLILSGDHLERVVSRLPEGAPARELRRMNRPVGVIAVFAASNFPLAFSVAGGDTASALAAGCPVIVKAHYGHPQTSSRVAELLERALCSAGLPAKATQILHGGTDTGRALVSHPDIAAVGFTGSTAGGRALSDLAAARPAPIPVYAEQGSLNPVVIAPSAFGNIVHEAGVLAASVSTGAGQFCTKPGLIFVPDAASNQFATELEAQLAQLPTLYLLTEKIHAQFNRLVSVAAAVRGVEIWRGDSKPGGFATAATVLVTDVETFVAEPTLREELFGPATVVIRVRDEAELRAALNLMDGSLTATLHGAPDDSWLAIALESLGPKVGRLVYGGVPTGVAVAPAMHHGGPYPASSSPLHTSVGASAIYRFLRPIAYQDFPDALLPAPLRSAGSK